MHQSNDAFSVNDLMLVLVTIPSLIETYLDPKVKTLTQKPNNL